MVATTNSASRSVRTPRLDSTKKGNSTRMKTVLSPSQGKKKDELVVDEIVNIEIEPEVIVPQVNSAQQATISLPPPSTQPLDEKKDEPASTIQPRRSMTRARKPSSRLLPSPSPPPTRPSINYHHYTASKAASVAAAGPTSTSASSASKNSQKKQQAAIPTPSTTVTEAPHAVVSASPTMAEEIEFGPGKRKRRPSTMSKPPSTITKQACLAGATPGGGSVMAVPFSATTFKIRLGGRVPSKSQSPEEKNQGGTREKASKKTKAEVVDVDQASLLVPSKTEEGYESDGNAEGARLMVLAEPDGEQDHEEDSDAGPSTGSLSKRAGIARTKLHPLSAAREKFGARRWPTCNGSSTLEPPPLISRRGGLKAHQGLSHASQRSVKMGPSDNLHSRSQSASALDDKWAWAPSAIAPTLRFRLAGHAGDDDSSEASDIDEEDDFHVAMLDGGDFGESSHDHAASLSSKSSHRDSKSGDDSEGEDTPATTPRSPQSTCDLPERRWSTGVDEEEKENRKGSKDAVFAHALEPSSRRPHTHAGALTLSLPFEEMAQANEDEAVSSRKEKKSVEGITSSIKDEDEGNMASTLLSPAVHHSILGLSSKQHALLLSSPHAGSAFSSPALEASSQGIKSEPLPLSLPPPASSPGTPLTRKHREARNGHRVALSLSKAHHSSDSEEEEEEEVFEHAALVMDPPESMCLSELDRAWEQSEYLVKARRMVGSGSVEEDAIGEESIEEDSFEVAEERPKRGAKRSSLVALKEEGITKKSKTSPKSSPTTTRSGRRSARQSGIVS